MKVHLTGLDDSEKEDLRLKMVAFGLLYEENFTFSTNLLICDSILS